MSSRISNSSNLRVDASRNIKMFNANGKRMLVNGITNMKCYPKLINGKINILKRKCIATEFIVSLDVKADILLSCTELKKIGVIPENFPNVTMEEECNLFEDKPNSDEKGIGLSIKK